MTAVAAVVVAAAVNRELTNRAQQNLPSLLSDKAHGGFFYVSIALWAPSVLLDALWLVHPQERIYFARGSALIKSVEMNPVHTLIQ